MTGRIIKVCFIFLLVVLWYGGGWADDNQSQAGASPTGVKTIYTDADLEAKIKIESGPGAWPEAGVTGVFENPFIKAVPTTTLSPYYDTVGTTYYSYGANSRLQRQITRTSLGHIATIYTRAPSKTMQPRDAFYTSWFNTGARSAQYDVVQISDVAADTPGRGGFGMVTSLPDGRAVCVYHKSFSTITQLNYHARGTYISVEQTPALGDFGGNEFLAPDSVAVGSVPNKFRDSGIWPDGAGQKWKGPPSTTDTNFVHVVFTESNYATVINTRFFGYARAYENPANFWGNWSKPYIVDTLRPYICPTIVASKKTGSGKVAIIWIHPRKGYPSNPSNPDSLGSDADLYYIESTTGGDDWVNGFHNDTRDSFVNVTKYQDSDPLRAIGDLSAAYDEDDSLVITFLAGVFVPRQGISGTQGSIYFWRRGIGGGGSDLREVYNYSINDADARRLTHGWPVDNPHIGIYRGVHPDSIGDYYIIWTAAGAPNDTTSGTSVPLKGYWNKDIWCSASTNNGFSWSAISNLTNSHTPACVVGACDNDWFASLAIDINDTLHISYINSKVPVPGGQTRSTDTSRVNPVFYLKVQAKPVQKDTLCTISPVLLSGFKFTQGITNDTIVNLANSGNQTLQINSITANHPNASFTVDAPYGNPPFNIPEGGAPAKVHLSFNGFGLACSSYTVTWTFNTNAENHNLNNSKGIFTTTAEFALVTPSEPFFEQRSLAGLNRVVQVNNLRLNITNYSNVGGALGSKAGMFVVEADTGAHFMSHSGSCFATILNTGDTLAARVRFDDNEFYPTYIPGALNETILVKDTTITDNVSFATAIAQGRPATSGSWKVVKANYAVFIDKDRQYPTIDSLFPWPGPWLGYWFNDQWWFKNTATYHWVVWYRQRVKKAAPCWWPDGWVNQPFANSTIYDAVVSDWDVFSDSLDLSTGVNLPIDSTGYNDQYKYVFATGRGFPFNKRYGAQVFLCDTTMHLKTDSVCVGTACSTSVSAKRGIFGAHSISWEKYADQYGPGYMRTGDLYKWLAKPGASNDFINNKQDVIILTTHTSSAPSAETVAYALGLAVSTSTDSTLKKAINEMRKAMALDTVAGQICTTKPGNCNGDVGQQVNLVDIVFLVNKVFKSGPSPNPPCAGNANGDGTLANLVDIVYLVNYVFKGGPPPVKTSVCCL